MIAVLFAVTAFAQGSVQCDPRIKAMREKAQMRAYPKHGYLSSLSDLRYELGQDDVKDGDTLVFNPGLRGKVLTNDNPQKGFDIKKSITIIGNGVIVGKGEGFARYTPGGSLTFKDIVFREVNTPL